MECLCDINKTWHWRDFPISRNSSVGRALDWRSKGPWFNPGFRQFFFFFFFSTEVCNVAICILIPSQLLLNMCNFKWCSKILTIWVVQHKWNTGGFSHLKVLDSIPSVGSSINGKDSSLIPTLRSENLADEMNASVFIREKVKNSVKTWTFFL